MRTIISVSLLLVELIAAPGIGAMMDRTQNAASPHDPPLEQKVKHFALIDESLIDGIAKLSQLPIGLHFGMEEILGSTFSDPVARSVRFSLSLQDRTIREILVELCQSDARYTWSTDQATINVYPRSTVGDDAHLLNVRIQRIALKDIPQPEEALTSLDRQLPAPKQQLGYSRMGGNSRYAEPWTVVFEDLTVRQFINRITEHMGPRTSWSWHGTKNERFFTFLKDGVHTEREAATIPP